MLKSVNTHPQFLLAQEPVHTRGVFGCDWWGVGDIVLESAQKDSKLRSLALCYSQAAVSIDTKVITRADFVAVETL